ncbi:MAG: O-antigen ligase family protein [Candidatus Thiodiazotropha sp.]
MGNYLPFYNAIPISLGLSGMLLIIVFSKYKVSELTQYKLFNYTLIFILLTLLAMMHGLVRHYAIPPLKSQIGYFAFTIIGAFLLSDKKSFRLFTLVFTLVHAALVIINIDKLGAARVGYYKASFFLGDGNDFGWSMNVALPLAMHLAFTTQKQLYKYAYLGLAAIIVIGIVGTQSRGAFLALSFGLLYYLTFITKKKIAGFSLLAIVAIGLVLFSPDNYFSRMETIVNYEDDTSAMGRITAWGTALEMAADHPILGVGAGSFNSAYGRMYRKPDDPARWISTHSVYFKVVAEYGFPGIVIFLLSIWHTIKLNRKSLALTLEYQDRISITPLWPHALIWTTISWAISAAFLSGDTYPHLFIIMALTLALHRMILHEIDTASDTTEAAPIKSRPQYFS